MSYDIANAVIDIVNTAHVKIPYLSLGMHLERV